MDATEAINSAVNGFKRFNMPSYGEELLRNFLWFKQNYYSVGHKKELRNNFLVQCDDEEEQKAFLDEMASAMKKVGVLPKGHKIIKEGEFSSERSSLVDVSMIGIYCCKAIERDSVGIVSSSVRSKLQDKRVVKDSLWKLVKDIAALSPDTTIIAVGPKGFIDYIRESNDLYYRFFAQHLPLYPLTAKDAYKATLDEIAKEGLIANDGFKDKLKSYINEVYPKADLKSNSFVQDLTNRILVSYYLHPRKDKNVGEKCVPFYRKRKPYKQIADQFETMVGLDKVKKTFEAISRLDTEPGRERIPLNFAFVGNPGTGKTTVAGMTAELLYSMQLIEKNKLVSVVSTDILSSYKNESIQLMQEKIEEAAGGVLFIDEAYFLLSETRVLPALLAAMDGRRNHPVVILAGYTKEIDKMLAANDGLRGRISHRFEFEDFKPEELICIFKDLAASDGLTVENEAESVLSDRIEVARTEPNFSNARSIAKIYNQIKVIRLEQKRDTKVITAEDIQKSMPAPLGESLDAMIGLDNIKSELKNFETRVKYLKVLKEKGIHISDSNMHMLFTGNPGTGKTTVAMKIADCLYQIGVLKTNKLIVAERKDLVSNAIGGTAIKTNEVIKQAMNGVLFIDEAYTLKSEDGLSDFGKEALATLITAMETYKNSLIVIFAGYRDKMKDFLAINPGIASRIGFAFHFPDYTKDELTDMFVRKMKTAGFFMEKGCEQKIKSVMEYFSTMENFGNGRFVDKMIDQTISKRSGRSYDTVYNDISCDDIPGRDEIRQLIASPKPLWMDEDKSENMRWRIAVHEAGHAFVSLLMEPKQKVETVTIAADAEAMGRTSMRSTDKLDGTTESLLKTYLATQFGGRNAERIIFGEHSEGCIDDIAAARKLAKYMVEEMAVGEFGVTTPNDLLIEADRKAAEILSNHADELEKAARKLMENGKLTGEELECFLK